MIPACHGRPAEGLVPWARMYKSRSIPGGYSCVTGTGWWMFLWPDKKNLRIHNLYLAPEGEDRFKTPWITFREAWGRDWWIEGYDGLSSVLGFLNPWEGEPGLSLYHANYSLQTLNAGGENG